MFRTSADAGVNLDVFLPVRILDGQFCALIGPDNLEAAPAALGNQVTTE